MAKAAEKQDLIRNNRSYLYEKKDTFRYPFGFYYSFSEASLALRKGVTPIGALPLG